MDPPPRVSFGEKLGELWDDAKKNPSDFGIAGVAARREIKKAFGAIKNNLFAKRVQSQYFDVNISSQFRYKENIFNDENVSAETKADKVVDSDNENDKNKSKFVDLTDAQLEDFANKLSKDLKDLDEGLSIGTANNSVIIINYKNTKILSLELKTNVG